MNVLIHILDQSHNLVHDFNNYRWPWRLYWNALCKSTYSYKTMMSMGCQFGSAFLHYIKILRLNGTIKPFSFLLSQALRFFSQIIGVIFLLWLDVQQVMSIRRIWYLKTFVILFAGFSKICFKIKQIQFIMDLNLVHSTIFPPKFLHLFQLSHDVLFYQLTSFDKFIPAKLFFKMCP